MSCRRLIDSLLIQEGGSKVMKPNHINGLGEDPHEAQEFTGGKLGCKWAGHKVEWVMGQEISQGGAPFWRIDLQKGAELGVGIGSVHRQNRK